MAKEDMAKSPKSKKTKEVNAKAVEVEAVPYEVRLKAVTAISKPMASEKQTKKLYKLVKKAAKEKICRRGVKEVCKGVRQGRKGICIIAGDISPIDVISHMASYCEDQGVNYIYVPSKVDLGAAAKTKRPTSCVLITPPRETKDKIWDPNTKQLFDDMTKVCIEEMSQVPTAPFQRSPLQLVLGETCRTHLPKKPILYKRPDCNFLALPSLTYRRLG